MSVSETLPTLSDSPLNDFLTSRGATPRCQTDSQTAFEMRSVASSGIALQRLRRRELGTSAMGHHQGLDPRAPDRDSVRALEQLADVLWDIALSQRPQEAAMEEEVRHNKAEEVSLSNSEG